MTTTATRPPTGTTPLDTRFFGHPRGLATLFFTEMWERFTYYGMRALLILFMTAKISEGGLGFGTETAGPVYAMYVALAYLATVPGGWLADNFLGQRKSVLYGGILIAAGNALLVIHGLPNFFAGLGCIVLGVGLLKPNISVIVGQLYTTEDKRRDAGFSIFYMGINIGALISPLICGWLAQSDKFKSMLSGWGMEPTTSWHWGFGAAALGMTLGVVQYIATGHHLGQAGLHPTPPATPAVAARNKRTLTIGIVSTIVLAVALIAFDRSAKYYTTVRWAAGELPAELQPKEGTTKLHGLVVTASGGEDPAPLALAEGKPIAAGELKAVLGDDSFARLKRETFRQRVAASAAAGANASAYLRIPDPRVPASAKATDDAQQPQKEVEAEPVPSVRLQGLRWVDVPGGVEVFAKLVEDPNVEVPLGVLRADALDSPPESLSDAVDSVLGTVAADAVAAGATEGELTGAHVKVGGLNPKNIDFGFRWALAAIVIGFFAKLFLAGEWTPAERARLITIFVLFCGASVFWGIFEQAGSTLTLFADRSTNNSLFGFTWPSSWWQSVNAVLIVLLAPVFAWLWIRMGKSDPSYPAKFAIGLVFAGLGFALLIGGATLAKGGHEVSPLWLLGVYLLHTIGELCLSPVGLSSMTKLAPARVVSLMMGVWFLAASVGNYIGGSVAGFYENFELPTLFAWVAGSGIAMAFVMFLLVAPIKRMMARSAEAKG